MNYHGVSRCKESIFFSDFSYLPISTLQANIFTTHRVTGEIICATSATEVWITLSDGQETWTLLRHALGLTSTPWKSVLTLEKYNQPLENTYVIGGQLGKTSLPRL